jgi:hypothetical protein
MPPAVIGAAIVGTAGIASATIGSSAAKKAAQASQQAADASAAVQNRALDLQQQNTAKQREVGNAALDKLASRFDLSTPTAQQSATVAQPKVGDTNWDALLASRPDLAAAVKDPNSGLNGSTDQEKLQDWYTRYGKDSGVDLPTYTAEDVPATTASTVDSQGNYTVSRPTVGTAPTYQAPTLGAAPTYQTPTYRETQVAPLDVSLSSYQQSPDYQFQLDEGNKNITNNAAVSGTLQSGAALKALQKYGQDLALGDYNQWRDYATNQYNTNRSNVQSQDSAANSFNTTQANNQYAAANNAYQFGANYAANNALNSYNAANSAYQYGANLAQNNYTSDRDYATGQYNANTNALLGLAGQGASATGAINNAIGSNASALSNIYTNNANTQGNASLANAGLVNSALGTGVNALAYYYGNKGSNTTTPTASSQYYNY